MSDQIKDGGPAFPYSSLAPDNVAGGMSPTMYADNTGMTLRDYFAARAPIDIPEWFVGPAAPAIPRPVSPTEIAKEAAEWECDPCYDLDGVFEDADRQQLARAYQETWTRYGEATEAAKAEHVAARYFAWRWHYAAALLAAREQQ